MSGGSIASDALFAIPIAFAVIAFVLFIFGLHVRLSAIEANQKQIL